MAQSKFISEFTNGKELRVLGSIDEPLFVAKDVAEFLGYKDTKTAIIDHVDEEDKITFKKEKENKGGEKPPFNLHDQSILINESGLYSLILRSKLEKAKEFKRWVTSVVLPSIRKNGNYKIEIEQLKEQLFMKQSVLQNMIDEKEAIKSNYIHLIQVHDKLKKKRNYYKFKKGTCFYIISDSWREMDNIKYKIGKTNDINHRLQNYRTSMPELKIHFLVYSDNDDLIEKCMTERYNKNLIDNNHEYISNISINHLMSSVKHLVDFLHMNITYEENLHKYNDFYENFIEEVNEEEVNEEVNEDVNKDINEEVNEEVTEEQNEEVNSEIVVEYESDTEEDEKDDVKITYDCKNCSKIFKYECYLKKHMKKEHDIDIELNVDTKCNICNKEFANRGKCKRHIKVIHEKSTTASCKKCKKTFVSGESLKNHIKTVHDKLNSQKCPQCDKIITTRGNLAKHIAEIHEKQTAECEICHKHFCKSALLTHVNSVHNRLYVNSCEICNKEFISIPGLKYHMAVVHKV